MAHQQTRTWAARYTLMTTYYSERRDYHSRECFHWMRFALTYPADYAHVDDILRIVKDHATQLAHAARHL